MATGPNIIGDMGIHIAEGCQEQDNALILFSDDNCQVNHSTALTSPVSAYNRQTQKSLGLSHFLSLRQKQSASGINYQLRGLCVMNYSKAALVRCSTVLIRSPEMSMLSLDLLKYSSVTVIKTRTHPRLSWGLSG